MKFFQLFTFMKPSMKYGFAVFIASLNSYNHVIFIFVAELFLIVQLYSIANSSGFGEILIRVFLLKTYPLQMIFSIAVVAHDI